MKKTEFYHQHCLIEASAGTGKTWTIIEIYKNLLFDEGMNFDEILIVTFTEKAASELKKRIYQLLLDHQEHDPDGRIKRALNHFTSAPIYTIHGFCQTLLSEYSFETRIPFDNQLVDDFSLIDEVFDQTLGRLVQELNSETMPALDLAKGEFLMMLGDFPGVNRQGILKLKERTIKASLQLMNHPGLIIIPENINISKQLSVWVKDHINEIPIGDLGILKQEYLIWSIKKKESKIFDSLEVLIKTFEVRLIYNLYYAVKELKTEKSFLSYSDMLEFVKNATQNNSAFVKSARSRFCTTIVDEFQDTDHIQWEIFKNLFISDNSILILVGDPKQAIYGFRGADVYAYLDAKKNILELEKNQQASLLNLETNYRSDKGLIQILNAAFSSKHWFGNDLSNIDYQYVAPANKGHLKIKKTELPVNRKNLNILELKNPEEKITAGIAKFRLISMIASEIRFLIASNWEILENDLSRTIKYSDIAILVRTKKEAQSIKKFFDKNKVPSSFYKEQGLYQKPQAMELLIMLEAIEIPDSEHNKARLAFTRWHHLLIDNQKSVLDSLLKQCNWLAFQRKWPLVFSILSNNRDFRNNQDHAKEDIIWSQIQTQLLDLIIQNQMNIKMLISNLKKLINKSEILSENLDLINNDFIHDSVKIMTIHASKGLEYPVVFLAGGLTQMAAANTPFYKYHKLYKSSQTIHIDLLKSKGNKSLHELELLNEEKKLLYVACTRAMVLLYLPLIKSTRSPGPSGGFLYDVLQEIIDEKSHIYGSISWRDIGTKLATELNSGNAEFEPGIKNLERHTSTTEKNDMVAFPDLRGKKTSLDSFTSLHSRNKNTFIHVKTRHEKMQDCLIVHKKMDDISIMDKHLRGVHAGNLFHELLETMDFSNFKEKKHNWKFDQLNDDLQLTVINLFNKNSLEHLLLDKNIKQKLLDGVVQIISNTLTVDLKIYLPGKQSFCLSDLPKNQKIHEMDFIFQHKHSEHGDRNFITGSIDLIFLYKKKYYIVDWKSNYHPENYNSNSINEIMESHDYHLQYLIYTHSLCLYLKSKNKDFNYDRDFGGVFYLFIRGIGADKNNHESGIFFYKPDKIEMDTLVLNEKKN